MFVLQNECNKETKWIASNNKMILQESEWASCNDNNDASKIGDQMKLRKHQQSWHCNDSDGWTSNEGLNDVCATRTWKGCTTSKGAHPVETFI